MEKKEFLSQLSIINDDEFIRVQLKIDDEFINVYGKFIKPPENDHTNMCLELIELDNINQYLEHKLIIYHAKTDDKRYEWNKNFIWIYNQDAYKIYRNYERSYKIKKIKQNINI